MRNLNGSLTNNSDLADYVGFMLTNRYTCLSRHGKERLFIQQSVICACRLLSDMRRESTIELLPGLKNYTENQQMWLAEALADCGLSEFSEKSQTYRMSKLHWQTGVHAVGAFRLIGPLSNSKQFSNDRACPKNSKMNPENKCTIWGKDL